ncbi:hypothetical protein F5Y04DRAFT_161412 [Hypomontagnella monticulosa]|nr:hypothetical protein F5Y04DRAFT_161412 [Hypomontagnella monticulosa]
MGDYAAAAITAISAAAAIVGSSGEHRQRERVYSAYRASTADENSPWQQAPNERSPFTRTRPRHAYGYYAPPLYYTPGVHEHHVHHAECPGAQCHYRAFLTDSIQRYNDSRRGLRETYIWNLGELSRMHLSQPHKSERDKAAELDRLYAYYVSRVRGVYEDHRRDHRRLFGQDYLSWAQPEQEYPARLRGGGGRGRRLLGRIETISSSGGDNLIREDGEPGSSVDCGNGGGGEGSSRGNGKEVARE